MKRARWKKELGFKLCVGIFTAFALVLCVLRSVDLEEFDLVMAIY
jgi:hypothetical protein